MTTYKNWGNTEKQFVSKHYGEHLSEESHICKKHYIEAKRFHNNSEYIPKWKNTEITVPSSDHCLNPECQDRLSNKLIKPAFASVTDLEQLFGIETSSSSPFLLCQTCYNKLYRLYTTPANCSTCGATAKPGHKFIRHCPDPLLISKYIRDTTGADKTITSEDWICTTCYNTQCTIIRSIRGNEVKSDEMLTRLIEEWKATIAADNTDRLTRATLSSVLFVAQQLLPNKAALLPWACNVFLQAYGVHNCADTKSAQVILDVEDGRVHFSSRWLLHQPILYLEGFMIHKCIHRKYGTILYQKGAEILASLSWALSTSQLASKTWFEPEIQQQQHDDVNITLKEASNIVNNLIHKEINKTHIQPSFDFASLNVTDQLAEINPLLLEFLTGITNPARERDTKSVATHTKKLRLFYILSQLMFCTNPKKPTPLHDIIADTIEVCGGSRQLIRIFNRLGCCSSADTHDRFVTEYAIARRQSKIWDEIPSNVLL